MSDLKIQDQKSWLQFRLPEKTNQMILNSIVYLFVSLFIYTAASKLFEIDNLKRILKHYPLIGDWNILFAYLVPITEILVGVLLIVPFTVRIGLWASLLLMFSFFSYVVYMLVSGSDLPCNCGGIIAQLSWVQHVWFNGFFVLLSLIAIKLSGN